jgi:hypothetical protein
MMFHVSIEADDPRRVAEIFAHILGGEALPFPPVTPGSWVALAGDDRGTMIEVYPRGTEIHAGPGAQGAVGVRVPPRRHNATHMAIATKLDMDEVIALCDRAGWPAQYCRRGGVFGVIEIFAEGCQMVEVLTEEMQREYLDAISIENWKRMLETREFAEAA